MTKLFPAVAAALVSFAAAAAPPPASAPQPVVIGFLKSHGMVIERHFSAPGGLAGYVGRTPDGHEMVFYVPPSGAVALFGVMLDAQGHNLTQAFVHRYVNGPHYHSYYAALEKMHWIAEGSSHPQRIVYAFIDPNCPYCLRFWQEAQNYFSQGVQVRYVMVAVLGGTSMDKAGAILGAKQPSRALRRNESGFRNHEGGIEPLKSVPKAIADQIQAHNLMMRKFGFNGTPGLVWKDTSGDIRISDGLPPPDELGLVFGAGPGPRASGPGTQPGQQ